MTRFLFLLTILMSTAFAGPFRDTYVEAQEILTQYASETEVTNRMDLISQHFLGLPYGFNGPLGEGPNGRYDQDPLYRFDTFDCTTFVETIISLALAHSVDDFEIKMDTIRYEKGEVDYLKRNHFPSLQWVPNNIENGLLKEINHSIVDSSLIKVAEAIIDLPEWLKHIKIDEIKVPFASENQKQDLLEELHQQSVKYSPIIARIDYIEIATLVNAPSLLDRIPHGSLVNFVRPNWDLTQTAGTHVNVSHQGLLFKKGTTLFLRHASSGDHQTVAELPFLDYLKKFVNHPTLKGIHLMQVQLNH